MLIAGRRRIRKQPTCAVSKANPGTIAPTSGWSDQRPTHQSRRLHQLDLAGNQGELLDEKPQTNSMMHMQAPRTTFHEQPTYSPPNNRSLPFQVHVA
jgi:hypothetical protein